MNEVCTKIFLEADVKQGR